MKPRNVWQPIVEPSWTPTLFVLAAVLLGLVSNAAYDLLKQALGTAGGALIAAVLGLVGVVALYWAYVSLVGRRVVSEAVAPHRCLIALVSAGNPEQIPAHDALRYHLHGGNGHPGRLQHLYLVAGKRQPADAAEPPTSSWNNALALQKRYATQLQTCDILEATPDDCEDTKRACDEAWRRARAVLGLPQTDIIADVTGGRKLMSIGMALSAMETGCKLEYLEPNRLQPDGTADPTAGSEPRLLSLRFFLRQAKRED